MILNRPSLLTTRLETSAMHIIQRFLLATIFLGVLGCRGDAKETTISLTAKGHDSRIDLRWTPCENSRLRGYDIYRATSEEGPFLQLNAEPHGACVYSDFIGENDREYFYHIGTIHWGRSEGGEASNVASAKTFAMNDEELLTSVQEATFRYFWDHAHPTSGLAYERGRTGRLPYSYGRGSECAIGGSGFGLIALMIGAERDFVTREEAAERVLKIATFLEEKADRFHGAFPHCINGETGAAIPFGGRGQDDGADLVETSYMIQGMLTVRAYFDRDDPVEQEIRERTTRLWREVEWDFFLQHPDGKRLYWHWSPNHGWAMNLPIVGYNECMITYLLAIASPTHPIPPECYHEGWASSRRYVNGETYYGIEQPVGLPMGGPLFLTQYTFMSFDPRNKRDAYCDYFENCRRITQINRAHCIENPGGHLDYGPNVWGLTASDGPEGYRASSPTRDMGTLAPTAAISAMPFTPDESMAALRTLYTDYGDSLWGEYGFRDAMNLDRGWFARSYIAIDQGPIICMIENHRTGLCWRMFMSNPEIQPMMDAIGFESIEP